ncbi:hypothetical protein RRG08_033963 [Elysia crispata]|uniref:LITAF domain-containing protein n=1 Tax=Elysia crispata TaxID=231223 RepID=A0AAE0YS30_9GAST|nr:hypothetical protein RRG08_033963 [Elysia crispata]
MNVYTVDSQFNDLLSHEFPSQCDQNPPTPTDDPPLYELSSHEFPSQCDQNPPTQTDDPPFYELSSHEFPSQFDQIPPTQTDDPPFYELSSHEFPSQFDQIPPTQTDDPPLFELSNHGFPSQCDQNQPTQTNGPSLFELQSHVTVRTSQPLATAVDGSVLHLGRRSRRIICPLCQADVSTKREYESGFVTWMIVGGICFLGLWFGCCLIPFVFKSTKDVLHRCPYCKAIVARCDR